MTDENMLRTVSKPLPLQGADNTRDLGGYETSHGYKTAPHRFLRSDSLEALSASDIELLKEYGVGCCIDFRTEEVCRKTPSRLQNVDGIAYYNVPIDDHLGHVNLSELFEYADMGELYIEFLKRNSQEFREALRIVLRYRNQTVIYHCAAGKDRTGIFTMLLLKLAGVSEDLIYRDYQATEYYMRSKFSKIREALAALHQKAPDYVFSSAPEQLEKAVNYLETEYGSIEGYLQSIGMTGEECAELSLLLKPDDAM